MEASVILDKALACVTAEYSATGAAGMVFLQTHFKCALATVPSGWHGRWQRLSTVNNLYIYLCLFIYVVQSRRYRRRQRYSAVNGIEAFYNDSTDGDTTAIN